MVRLDRLEALADPDTTPEDLIGHRAVAGFIRGLVEEIRPQMLVAADMVQREQDGLPPLNDLEGDPYMDLSPDLDAPQGVDNTPQGAVQ